MHFPPTTLLALGGLIALLSAGCGPSYKVDNKPEEPPEAASPAEYLNKWPMAVKTPSRDKVRSNSAKDVGEDKVRFEDVRHREYEVTATKEGNGYRFDKPQRVKGR